MLRLDVHDMGYNYGGNRAPYIARRLERREVEGTGGGARSRVSLQTLSSEEIFRDVGM